MVFQQAQEHRPGGEVNITLPDLNAGDFLGFTGPVTGEFLHAVWGDGAGTYLIGGGDLFSTTPRKGVLIAAGQISAGPILDL